MLKRLRLRFVVVNMSIVTVILCIIFTMVFQFTKQNLETRSLTMLNTASSAPVQAIRPGDGEPQINLPFFSMRLENNEWVPDRSVFYDLSDTDHLKKLVIAAEANEDDSGILQEYGLRYYRSNTPMGPQISFVDISAEQDMLRKLVETCLFIGVLSFSVFLCISLLLARWAVKPVDIAWRQQKQFVADASHELKTPLTVIQTSTELLCQEENPIERSRFTDSILEMTHRMRKLIEELLILARSDSDQPLQYVSTVDLSLTVSEALLPFEPVFFEAGLTLSSQISPDVHLRGDAAKLRQLVDILLDNARKYSTPRGETVVSLQKSGKTAILQCTNPAEHLSSQQCRDIFKRFYRVDTVRTGGESFGLGLSIAESIVHRHGGKISAACWEDTFRVRVELPARE